MDRFLKSGALAELSASQGLMVYYIGTKHVSMRQLMQAHAGSNPAYHVRKMVAMNYVRVEASPRDARRLCIFLTPKGRWAHDHLQAVFSHHEKRLEHYQGMTPDRWIRLREEGRRWEVFWNSSEAWTPDPSCFSSNMPRAMHESAIEVGLFGDSECMPSNRPISHFASYEPAPLSSDRLILRPPYATQRFSRGKSVIYKWRGEALKKRLKAKGDADLYISSQAHPLYEAGKSPHETKDRILKRWIQDHRKGLEAQGKDRK